MQNVDTQLAYTDQELRFFQNGEELFDCQETIDEFVDIAGVKPAGAQKENKGWLLRMVNSLSPKSQKPSENWLS